MTDVPQSKKRPLVLIIDDDPHWLATLASMVESEGFQAVTTSDPTRVAAMLEDLSVDLVITDILMPQLSGNELIGEIRASHPSVPIVAMSGGGRTGNMEFLELAQKQGVAATISKPCRLQDLSSVLWNVLGKDARA